MPHREAPEPHPLHGSDATRLDAVERLRRQIEHLESADARSTGSEPLGDPRPKRIRSTHRAKRKPHPDSSNPEPSQGIWRSDNGPLTSTSESVPQHQEWNVEAARRAEAARQAETDPRADKVRENERHQQDEAAVRADTDPHAETARRADTDLHTEVDRQAELGRSVEAASPRKAARRDETSSWDEAARPKVIGRQREPGRRDETTRETELGYRGEVAQRAGAAESDTCAPEAEHDERRGRSGGKNRAEGGPAKRGGRRRGGGNAEAAPGGGTEAQAKEVCLRLLTDRARSRAELAKKLADKGFTPEVADRVLDRLTEVGLLDDAAFAEQWVHSRHTYSGRGKRALVQELRRKGIADTDAEAALTAITPDDEYARAIELVRAKLRTRTGTLDRDKAVQRLVAMLMRRGYNQSTAYAAVIAEFPTTRGLFADIDAESDDRAGTDATTETRTRTGAASETRTGAGATTETGTRTDADATTETGDPAGASTGTGAGAGNRAGRLNRAVPARSAGIDADAAADLVRRKLRTLSADLPRDTVLRRLVGMLARRGYNQSAAYALVKAELQQARTDADAADRDGEVDPPPRGTSPRRLEFHRGKTIRQAATPDEDDDPDAAAGDDERDRAAELVRKKLRTMSAELRRDKAASQLVGLLARRGISSATAYSVVFDELNRRGEDSGDHPTD